MVHLLLLDIDGTLTDATTSWLGDEVGWTQRYSVRDGEAILRIRARGVTVAALSRNKTLCARRRMEALGVDSRWLGVADKLEALAQIKSAFDVASEEIAYIGDGPEDADVFERVGISIAVRDAHPTAREAAGHVLAACGGERAVEEAEQYLLGQGFFVRGETSC